MATYNHFYELPVYKLCRSFRKEAVAIAKDKFPSQETFLLTAQLLDAARSITANIAEGFGRFHHQKNIQFCKEARGSLCETMEHLITAYDENYIEKETLTAFNKKHKRYLRELNP